MKLRSIGVIALTMMMSFVIAAEKPKVVTTTSQDAKIEKRVDSLLALMTLKEKIGQMNQLMNFVQKVPIDKDFADKIRKGELGSVLNALSPEMIPEMQRIAVEESRLKIPLIVGRDVIHGYRTIFPINLGLAAMFNPELVEQASRFAALEASSHGIRWTFAPMLDVGRDPRWGRIAETSGEDTYLACQYAKATIKGFQTDNLANPSSLVTCAKHFVGYAATSGGRDYNTPTIPMDELWNVYLPPFKTAIDNGTGTFMTAFNEFNGVPCAASKYLFKDLLRDKWKFNGFVISDWGSVENIAKHGNAANREESAIKALDVSVDMEMSSMCYIDNLEKLVKSGKVTEAQINNSVKNILRIKFKLGLFEHPYQYKGADGVLCSPAALAASKKAALQSTVLLQNTNNLLPLDKNKLKKVAVIGPMANDSYEQLGTWIFDGKKENTITPLTSLKEFLGDAKVNYAEGLKISRTRETTGFAAAIEAAKNSDVVLLYVGEESILSGEAHCRAVLDFPGAQTQLVDEIHKLGKPVVMIVMAGRPLCLEQYLKKADAILYAWHPGTMGGPALTDLIFGVEAPSGKLPITFPRIEGQIPIYYNHKNTGSPANDTTWVRMYDIPVRAEQTSLGNTSHYLDYGFEPLYEFGYGLSYTTFKYTNLKVPADTMKLGSDVVVTVDLTNTGKVEAEEVAQLYFRDPVAALDRPVRELKGFKRVRLKAGETQKVSFTLSPKEYGFYTSDIDFITEPGVFCVWVGGSSKAKLGTRFFLK